MQITIYRPFAIKKKIRGFLKAKKSQLVFRKYFQGEFDNQFQTIIDNKISRIKKVWYVHEHIHCSIISPENFSENFDSFEAFYYFPFKNLVPFRERIYLLYPSLFSLKKQLIFQMEILQNQQRLCSKEKTFFFSEDFISQTFLNRCMIYWYVNEKKKYCRNSHFFFKGELLNQGCTIFSLSGLEFLHIKDDLILTECSLLVNDRGFDEKGLVKYGNYQKIPFILERASNSNQLYCTVRQIRKQYK
jgi:hypothetical protein